MRDTVSIGNIVKMSRLRKIAFKCYVHRVDKNIDFTLQITWEVYFLPFPSVEIIVQLRKFELGIQKSFKINLQKLI